MHMSESIRSSSITHENCHLMGTLGRKTPEIPCCCWVAKVGSWVLLLGVDEIWELYWVSNEEYRGIVSCHIPVALLSIKLDSKT